MQSEKRAPELASYFAACSVLTSFICRFLRARRIFPLYFRSIKVHCKVRTYCIVYMPSIQIFHGPVGCTRVVKLDKPVVVSLVLPDVSGVIYRVGRMQPSWFCMARVKRNANLSID